MRLSQRPNDLIARYKEVAVFQVHFALIPRDADIRQHYTSSVTLQQPHVPIKLVPAAIFHSFGKLNWFLEVGQL